MIRLIHMRPRVDHPNLMQAIPFRIRIHYTVLYVCGIVESMANSMGISITWLDWHS